MQVKINKLPKSQVKLEIEVEPAEYQEYLERAARQTSKDLKIPGFRPGQVPFEIVQKQVGQGKLFELTLEDIIKHTFIKATREHNLTTTGLPQIKVLKMAPANPLVYQATVDLLPQVKLADLKDIKIKKKKIEVAEKEIDDSLKESQRMRAKEVLVDREAQEGDKVEIDYNLSVNQVLIEGGQQKKYPIYLGEKNLIPGIDKELKGLKKGDKKKFELKFPKDYFNKKLAGKISQCQVKVENVYEIQKDEVDDKFAQSLGEFKNLPEVKNQLKQNIKQEKEFEEEKRVEREMLDELIDKSTFEDLPENLISQETKIMVEELKNNLAGYQIDFNKWLLNLKKKEEDLKLDFTPQAVRRVKAALIIRETALREKIDALEKEVEDEINKILKRFPGQKEIIKRANTQGYKNYIRQSLINKKVVEWLKEKVVK